MVDILIRVLRVLDRGELRLCGPPLEDKDGGDIGFEIRYSIEHTKNAIS